MYMNCAPIEITSSSTDKTFYNGLPDIFVGNIDGQCMMNADASDVYNIPNPGEYGVMIQAVNLTQPRAGACPLNAQLPPFHTNGLDYLKANYPATGTVAGPAPTAAPPLAGPANSAPAESASQMTSLTVISSISANTLNSVAATNNPSPAASDANFSTDPTDGASSGPPSVAPFESSTKSPAPASPISTSAAASVPAPPPAQAPPSAPAATLATTPAPAPAVAPSGAGNPLAGTCTGPPCTGALYCYDSQHFGLCDTVVGQACAEISVAAGMMCTNGQYTALPAQTSGPAPVVVARKKLRGAKFVNLD
jgi:hypothetical protein